jgi:hypothetical protein
MFGAGGDAPGGVTVNLVPFFLTVWMPGCAFYGSAKWVECQEFNAKPVLFSLS